MQNKQTPPAGPAVGFPVERGVRGVRPQFSDIEVADETQWFEVMRPRTGEANMN